MSDNLYFVLQLFEFMIIMSFIYSKTFLLVRFFLSIVGLIQDSNHSFGFETFYLTLNDVLFTSLFEASLIG